jgi:3-deoxy-manno-octulosonate cytidylyltransferase (CMP-KDO synthetase)
MRAIAVIPARLASTRLPRKVLRDIAGRPMLAWVYEAVRAAAGLDDVIVATDADEIMAVCEKNGWHARMTSTQHRSGTERVHEVANATPADVYLNVQGDEPLAHPEQVSTLLRVMRDPAVQVGTIMTPASADDIPNPNAVKVVADAAGRALYFSRATIPFDRDRSGAVRYYKHLGFYAYRKAALDRFVAWPESALERAERLEQLRFLENGIDIHVAETPHNTIGVDTEEDLRAVEEILHRRGAEARSKQNKMSHEGHQGSTKE